MFSIVSQNGLKINYEGAKYLFSRIRDFILYFDKLLYKEFQTNTNVIRDVTAGASGATAVAPKFSDALTLFQPGGGRFCPTIAEVAP